MDLSSCFVAQGYEDVLRVFEGYYTKGWENCSSFTAYANGERVVHLVGGRPTPDSPMHTEDNLQPVMSSTKFAESVVIALLVQRGLLSYSDKISTHWPEFSQNGKENITVRQLMMHQAGLATLDRKLTIDDLFPELPEGVEPKDRYHQVASLGGSSLPSFLASQSLNWDVPKDEVDELSQRDPLHPHPQCYHAITRGLYASQLVRRVDPKHRPLSLFLQEEICTPLGIEFYIGLPLEHEERVIPMANIHPSFLFKANGWPLPEVIQQLPNAPEYDEKDPRFTLTDYEKRFFTQLIHEPNSLICRAINAMTFEGLRQDQVLNSRQVRACELPSSNGCTNSNSMAVLASLCALSGEWKGTKLFPGGSDFFSQVVEALSPSYSEDQFLLTRVPFTQAGFGFFEKNGTIGWGGAGGSLIRYHRELGVGMAYVPNTMGIRMAMNDPRPTNLLDVTLACTRRLHSQH